MADKKPLLQLVPGARADPQAYTNRWNLVKRFHEKAYVIV
jgi:hypothetical protein